MYMDEDWAKMMMMMMKSKQVALALHILYNANQAAEFSIKLIKTTEIFVPSQRVPFLFFIILILKSAVQVLNEWSDSSIPFFKVDHFKMRMSAQQFVMTIWLQQGGGRLSIFEICKSSK